MQSVILKNDWVGNSWAMVKGEEVGVWHDFDKMDGWS